MTSSMDETPLRLLALDGGGIRGFSELLVIKEVMHKIMFEENKKRKISGGEPLSVLPKPCDYFDMIGGTSTGGIIALMLGRLRMDVDTAIKHYDELAEKVFSEVKRWGDGKFKASKLETVIKTVVESVTGDPESPLLEGDHAGICRTFVCAKNAHNMNANIPVLFRTYVSRKGHTNCKIWEAARATSAAPTFFKRIEIGRNQPYIDGGLGRNNPSQAVLEEAEAVFGATRKIGCLVSIGTGKAKITNIQKPGVLQWFLPTNVIDALKEIAMDCEATHQDMLSRFANLPDTYFRLNVEQGMQGINLAEWEKLSMVEAHTANYMEDKDVEPKIASLVNAIRVPRAQLPLEQLIAPRIPIELVQRVFERKSCPHPVESFVGRKEILDKMHGYFGSGGSSMRHIFILHGLGGSGKSQLAFKFVQESNCFSDVFYVDASNERTLEVDLAAIQGTADKSAHKSLRWLASQANQKWLILFDNADDVNLKLSKYFSPSQSGNILVTTRNHELCHYSTKDADVSVTGLNPEDAMALLLQQARAEDSTENKVLAESIVKELYYFALAVSQAGAYIHCHSSLRDYQELYLHERDNLLQNEEVQGQDPYERAVYTTWRLSYDKLDTSARSLLQICSMLHHKGISEQMFKNAALSQNQLEDPDQQNKVTELLSHLGKQDLGWSSWKFQAVVRHLCSHSLIEYDHQNHTYSVHPLVHHWSRTTIEGNTQIMRECVLTIIGLSIQWKFNQDDYQYRRRILQHIISSRQGLLGLEKIDAFILTHLGLVYCEQGHWTVAEPLEVLVFEKSKQVLGDDHPDTLSSMTNLASTYRSLGRWRDAEALEVVVLEKKKQVLGDDHPDTLTSMSNLASTYRNLGRWTDAETLEVAVLEKMKQVLGDDHSVTLTAMSNLALTYWNLERYTDAEALEVVVLEKTKQVLGDDHPLTLTGMSNLASTYRSLGCWTDAEALEKVVLEKRKEVLGGDHPDTLMSMANLASTYTSLGRWTDAEALEVVVLEKRKQVLKNDHPDTLTSMSNLASTYRSLGRWTDAQALEVVVLEKKKQVLGDDHLETLISMANLAFIYSNLGCLTDAEALEVVVLEKMKHVLGDDHPLTLTSMDNLAITYRSLGCWTDAEALDMEVKGVNQRSST